MSLLNRILSIVKPPKADRNFWFYVQCQYCKEIIKGRIDMFSHLSIQYIEGKGGNNYYCRKVMIGGKRCYRPIEVEFWFDKNKKLSDQQIKGGKFVTKQEFLNSQGDSKSPNM